MYSLIRPILFRMNPESAHNLVLKSLALWPSMGRLATRRIDVDDRLHQELWGLSFPHPVGLAAGLDKDGVAVNGFLQMGFSFVEAGTVTPLPQPGNPSPRLFRLVEDEALINRMGFNNQGAGRLKQNLLRKRQPGLVGVNLGKNKVTPNEDAVQDYLRSLEVVYLVADYVVINVSSPNTPGLRDLQAESALVPLVRQMIQRRNEIYEGHLHKVKPHRPPILVKIAPDLSDQALHDLSRSLLGAGAEGFIAANTTITRPDLRSTARSESGGLSGKPVRDRATDVVRLIWQATSGSVPIMGSGGVFTAEDAYEKICAGASVVQLYTALIYRGPRVVRDIVLGLRELLQRDGFARLQDAVGSRANTQ